VPIIAALRAAIHAWRGSTHAISGIASIPGHQGERVIACISVAANQLSWVRHRPSRCFGLGLGFGFGS